MPDNEPNQIFDGFVKSAIDEAAQSVAVSFKYEDTAGQKALQYWIRDEPSGELHTIDGADIVGILSSHDKEHNYTTNHVLYIKSTEAITEGDGPKDSIPVLHALATNALPGQLSQDFPSNGISEWLAGALQDKVENVFRYIIVSTLSGSQAAMGCYQNAVNPLLRQIGLRPDQDYSLVRTESAQSITDFTTSVIRERAAAGISQAIILLSGDGGIVDLINALMPPAGPSFLKPRVALVPMGTANALAHSIGVTKDNTLGLPAVLRGSPHPLPIFKATFSPGSRLLVDEARQEEELPRDAEGTHAVLYGAVVASWGHHAALVADSDTSEYRKFGAERFKLAAKEALFPSDGSEPHRYRGRVSVLRIGNDGKESWSTLEREEHAYVLATTVSNLEKTFTISPSAKPLDGSLRLVHFGPVKGERFMELMTLAYQGGKHVDEPEVGYEDIEGLRIDFGGEQDGRWRRVCIDGKIVRVEEHGWLEVRKEAQSPIEIMRLAGS